MLQTRALVFAGYVIRDRFGIAQFGLSSIMISILNNTGFEVPTKRAPCEKVARDYDQRNQVVGWAILY